MCIRDSHEEVPVCVLAAQLLEAAAHELLVVRVEAALERVDQELVGGGGVAAPFVALSRARLARRSAKDGEPVLALAGSAGSEHEVIDLAPVAKRCSRSANPGFGFDDALGLEELAATARGAGHPVLRGEPSREVEPGPPFGGESASVRYCSSLSSRPPHDLFSSST